MGERSETPRVNLRANRWGWGGHVGAFVETTVEILLWGCSNVLVCLRMFL